jgi:hypothetical protein
MRLLSEIVRALLGTREWGLSRRISGKIRGTLVAIALVAPGAFIIGSIAYANDEACAVDAVVVPALSLPKIARMQVVERSGVCEVVQSPTTIPIQTK